MKKEYYYFRTPNLDGQFYLERVSSLGSYLTLTDRAPIRTFIDWGGGALLSPPLYLRNYYRYRPKFFVVRRIQEGS